MDEIDILRQHYLELINNVLPSIAEERGFPVTHNHCWGRILLDNLFKGCWYNYLTVGKVPAYKQLDASQLRQVIDIAQSLINRDLSYVNKLNQQSLEWRRARLKKE